MTFIYIFHYLITIERTTALSTSQVIELVPFPDYSSMSRCHSHINNQRPTATPR